METERSTYGYGGSSNDACNMKTLGRSVCHTVPTIVDFYMQNTASHLSITFNDGLNTRD